MAHYRNTSHALYTLIAQKKKCFQMSSHTTSEVEDYVNGTFLYSFYLLTLVLCDWSFVFFYGFYRYALYIN